MGVRMAKAAQMAARAEMVTLMVMVTLAAEARFPKTEEEELLVTKVDPNQTEHLGKWLE